MLGILTMLTSSAANDRFNKIRLNHIRMFQMRSINTKYSTGLLNVIKFRSCLMIMQHVLREENYWMNLKIKILMIPGFMSQQEKLRKGLAKKQWK